MAKEILITGGNGALGSEFRHVSEARYNQDLLLTPRSGEFNITDIDACRDYLRQQGPLVDVIIHAAAMTNWEQAHANPEQAFRVNTLGTRNMALLAKEANARLVVISTDAVFPGTVKPGGYTEGDIPHNPTNIYGMTKLAGEWQALSVDPDTFIARIGWLFGPNAEKDTKFVGAILRQLAKGKEVISAVTDKAGSPTYTLDAVSKIFDHIDHGTTGVRHIVNDGVATRFEVAEEVVKTWNAAATVEPVTSDMFPSPVKRPDYSGMTTIYSGEKIRPWQAALLAYRDTHPLEEYK